MLKAIIKNKTGDKSNDYDIYDSDDDDDGDGDEMKDEDIERTIESKKNS